MKDWRDRESDGTESRRIPAEAWLIGALMGLGLLAWIFDILH